MKTLNLNAFYVFNSRRFSYPAAFSQTYIQRRSAGSFLLAFSGQGQLGKLKMEKNLDFKMMKIGLGAGYGYNFVPRKGWLLHISALPALIILSKTSMSFGEERVPMTYGSPIPISAKQRILPSITTNGASARFSAGDSDAFAPSYLMTTFFPFRMYMPGRNG